MNTKWFGLLILVLLLLAVATVQPVLAEGPVVGTLVSVVDNVATFSVSADGEYILLQEGNQPSEHIHSTAVDGIVKFQMKPGNSALKLDNIRITTMPANWRPCEGASDWLCKIGDAVPAPAVNDRSEWQAHFQRPCGLWTWDGANIWTWSGSVEDEICQSEWHLSFMRQGDKFVFVVPVAWESATIDAVWGNLSGQTKENWTGVYLDKIVPSGTYTWQDLSGASNNGFRAKPMKPVSAAAPALASGNPSAPAPASGNPVPVDDKIELTRASLLGIPWYGWLAMAIIGTGTYLFASNRKRKPATSLRKSAHRRKAVAKAAPKADPTPAATP